MTQSQILSALTAAKKLLVQWQIYYVFLVAGLGFWLYKDENRIVELQEQTTKEDADHKNEMRDMRKELNANDCVEQFKVWKNALEGEVRQEEKKEQFNIEEINAIRQQNNELNKTLKLLNQKQ